MDNLKLDAIGLRKCTLFRIVTNPVAYNDGMAAATRDGGLHW